MPVSTRGEGLGILLIIERTVLLLLANSARHFFRGGLTFNYGGTGTHNAFRRCRKPERRRRKAVASRLQRIDRRYLS